MKRGALIVIEGVDRTGKSTQCKALVNNLGKQQHNAIYMNFPKRDTEIGKVIDSYLRSKNNLPDRAIHLLFSANRWEMSQEITNTLEQGISVIIDRYCYSGVAFSAAKGLDIEWCKSTDSGLPKPDKVFFLTMPIESILKRNGFGNERYEVNDFQKKVIEKYDELIEDNWEVLDADRSIETIENELLEKTLLVSNDVENRDLSQIWIDA